MPTQSAPCCVTSAARGSCSMRPLASFPACCATSAIAGSRGTGSPWPPSNASCPRLRNERASSSAPPSSADPHCSRRPAPLDTPAATGTITKMQIRTRTIERLRDALLQSGRRQSDVISSADATLARAGLLTDQQSEPEPAGHAVAEVMYLVTAADGQITDTEYAALRGATRGLTGEVPGHGIIDVLVEGYELRLRDHG